jgi:Flp pilus assembly protein TadD
MRAPATHPTGADTGSAAGARRAPPPRMPRGEHSPTRTIGGFPPPPPSTRLPQLPPNKLPPPPARKPRLEETGPVGSAPEVFVEESHAPGDSAAAMALARTVYQPTAAALDVPDRSAGFEAEASHLSVEDAALEPGLDPEDANDSWASPLRAGRTRTLLAGSACVIAGLALAAFSIVSAGKTPGTTSDTRQQVLRERPVPTTAAAAIVEPSAPSSLPAQPKSLGQQHVENPAGLPKASVDALPSADVPDLPLLDGSGSKAPTCDELLAGTLPPAKPDINAAYQQKLSASRELVRGDVDATQTALCRASRLAPNNPEILHDMAQLLLIRRDGAAAAEWAQRSVDLDPNNSRARALLGDALARTGRPAQAQEAWLAASHVAASDAAAVDLLIQMDFLEAERTLKRRDYRRAERFFRRVVSLKPTHATANAGLAAALLKLGDSRAADTWARRAVTLREDDPRIQTTAGNACLALGSREEAEAHWRRALEIDPRHAEAKLRITQLSALK